MQREALRIPNLSHPDAPQGTGEEANRELRQWGKPTAFSFTPRDHVELAARLDLVDFETAARVTGPKFYYLRNQAVLLELALVRYALDILSDRGVHPDHPPPTWPGRRSSRGSASTPAARSPTSTPWRAPEPA